MSTDDGGHQEHGHGHEYDIDWSVRAEQLELEGETLAPVAAGAIDWVRSRFAAAGEEVARIVDVGCGPGVAATALAATFGGAEVVAVDVSGALLVAAEERATRLGVGGRLRTVQADLAAPLPIDEPADLVWASMVVHHLGDEVAVLSRLRDVLRPGGQVVVTEFGLPTRVLPDELGIGRPGLDDRCRAAQEGWLHSMRAGLEGSVDDDDTWPEKLRRAGFVDVEERLFGVQHGAPLSTPLRHFVHTQLARTRERFASRLDAGDIATLDVLLLPDHPSGVYRRDDVFIEASRTVVVGTRPA